MFDSLSDRLGSTLKKIRGQGRITEENVKETQLQGRRGFRQHLHRVYF